jgi:RNA polymerase sigma factor (sigma-70 family)
MGEEFVAFCAREHEGLVGALTLWCGDGDVAEEVVQEAFARAYRDWHRVGSMEAPGAWVRRVAMNVARSRFRRWQAERRARVRLRSEQVHRDSDAADVVAVRRAVSGLPEQQRTAVVLRYFLDLPVAEVAGIMRRSPSAVTSLTNRAIVSLRAALDDRDLALNGEVQP